MATFSKKGGVAARAVAARRVESVRVEGAGSMQYRKKPVVIEAVRWFKNGDHPKDYVEDTQGFEDGRSRTFTGVERRKMGWEGGIVRYFRSPNVDGGKECNHCGRPMHVHGWMTR